MKEAQGDDRIPYPEGVVNDTFRHTWIIQKRNRPVAPLFIGSPVPLKRADSAERSAMLTMAYFHPWTLRAGDADGSVVPFAGNLRSRDVSWQSAIATWLDGNVVSQESVRYINNLMSVYRIRPHDPSEDVLSDEDFSDEELELTEADLARALQTRIGGRESQGKGAKKEPSGGKATHEQNSRQGIRVAQQVWSRADDLLVKESDGGTLDSERMKDSLKAARASQRQNKAGLVTVDEESFAQVQKYASCSKKDIDKWL